LRCLERPDRQISGRRLNRNQRMGKGQNLGRLVLIKILVRQKSAKQLK
jgi:hypothetical protein